jgi:hypothetical protein
MIKKKRVDKTSTSTRKIVAAKNNINLVRSRKNTSFDISDIDEASIILDDINTRDYPDFSDAYISYAEFKDGTPLTDEQLDELNRDSSFIHEMVMKLFS